MSFLSSFSFTSLPASLSLLLFSSCSIFIYLIICYSFLFLKSLSFSLLLPFEDFSSYFFVFFIFFFFFISFSISASCSQGLLNVLHWCAEKADLITAYKGNPETKRRNKQTNKDVKEKIIRKSIDGQNAGGLHVGPS